MISAAPSFCSIPPCLQPTMPSTPQADDVPMPSRHCQDLRSTRQWLVGIMASFLFRQEVTFKLCPNQCQNSAALGSYTMDDRKTAHLLFPSLFLPALSQSLPVKSYVLSGSVCKALCRNVIQNDKVPVQKELKIPQGCNIDGVLKAVCCPHTAGRQIKDSLVPLML